MRDYKIYVEYLPSQALEYNSINKNSLSKIESLGQENAGFKGFFFSGGDKTKNSGCWADGTFKCFSASKGYSGFLGDTLSSDEKIFAKAQSITISGSEITDITITFDRIAGEYAEELRINGQVYTNTRNVFVAQISPAADSVTIEFTKWSKANSLVKVTSILCGMSVTYEAQRLTDIAYTKSSASSLDSFAIGITLQSGSFTVIDNGKLEALNNAGMLHTEVPVIIYCDGVKVQEFITSDYDSNVETNEWTITLTDDIVNWQEEQFSGLLYEDRTLKDILQILVPDLIFDESFEDMFIPNSFLNVSTKWDAIVKCCQLGFLTIYKINGQIYCKRLA